MMEAGRQGERERVREEAGVGSTEITMCLDY